MDEKWKGWQGWIEETVEMFVIKSREKGPVPGGAGLFCR